VPQRLPRTRWALIAALALAALVTFEASAQASSPPDGDLLERAASLTQARDWAAVIELLEPAYREDPTNAETALLLAIAYYRHDRRADAAPLFRGLAAHPDDEIAEPAQLFLGLLAREGGDEAEARRLFRDVATSSSVLGESAQKLLRPTAGQRFTAAASLRSGIDSNVPLLSSDVVGPGASPADANLLLTAAAVAWPSSSADVRILAAGAYRKHARLTDYDFFAGRAGLSYAHTGARFDFGAGYAFEASALGGALLSNGHAADLSARLPGRRFAELAYALRVRSYAPEGYRGYSGDAHRGLAWLGTRFRLGEAAVAAVADAERTRDADLAGWGFGARARVSLRHKRLSFRAHGEVLPRHLGGRQDLRAEASAAFAYALGDHFALLLGASALSNRSTAPEFQHVKAAAYTGLELRL
jgi:hypothetical protein